MKEYPQAARVQTSFAGTGAQTGTAIYTPTSGYRLILTELLVTVSESATVTVYRGATNTAAARVLYGVFAAGVDRAFTVPIELDEDEVLRITTSAGNCAGVVGGFELPAR